MFCRVDKRALADGVASPQDEDKSGAVGREPADYFVGKFLPSSSLVRTGATGFHGEGGVEQEHTLIGPAGKIAVVGVWRTGVGAYLLEDVDK